MALTATQCVYFEAVTATGEGKTPLSDPGSLEGKLTRSHRNSRTLS
jgi:hypothetical protein